MRREQREDVEDNAHWREDKLLAALFLIQWSSFPAVAGQIISVMRGGHGNDQ